MATLIPASPSIGPKPGQDLHTSPRSVCSQPLPRLGRRELAHLDESSSAIRKRFGCCSSGGAFNARASASGHSSRNSHSQTGCAHNVSTNGRSAAGDGSVSMCHGNEGMRMHFACVASVHGVEPHCNNVVSGRHECV